MRQAPIIVVSQHEYAKFAELSLIVDAEIPA